MAASSSATSTSPIVATPLCAAPLSSSSSGSQTEPLPSVSPAPSLSVPLVPYESDTDEKSPSPSPRVVPPSSQPANDPIAEIDWLLNNPPTADVWERPLTKQDSEIEKIIQDITRSGDEKSEEKLSASVEEVTPPPMKCPSPSSVRVTRSSVMGKRKLFVESSSDEEPGAQSVPARAQHGAVSSAQKKSASSVPPKKRVKMSARKSVRPPSPDDTLVKFRDLAAHERYLKLKV